ncbi:hypothetical protein KDL44_11235 [bacterium]|nr:hypothetical protein [bacterium]
MSGVMRFLLQAGFGLGLSLAMLMAVPAAACLNDAEEDHINFENQQASSLERLLHPSVFNVKKWQRAVLDYEQDTASQQAWAADSNDQAAWDARNSYAVALVYSGAVEKARDVWIEMEERRPGEYKVAANLGTAYELTGDNVNALKWINEGLKRNPDSHSGTEWLHSRILEAKLALATNPDWLKHNRVTGMESAFQDGRLQAFSASSRNNRGDNVSIGLMRMALQYQLKERLGFIRSADPMVAQLLVDLGDVELQSSSPKSALVAYQRAIDYGVSEDELAERMAFASGADRTVRTRNLMFGIAGLLLVFLIVLVRRRQSQEHYD